MSDKQAADLKVERYYKAYLQTQMENDEKSFNLVRDVTSDDGRGVWGTEANAIIDTRQLKALFYNENWVFIVVDLIAMKICTQPMFVYRKEMVGGKNNYVIAEDHPTQKKLDNPNKFQDYASFMYCLVADLITCGNSIVWKGVSNQQMFLFGPEEMQIDFNKMGEITTYNKVSGSSENLQITGKFAPDKIIHPKRPNPSSLFWGLSPFVPGRKSILFNRYSQEYLNSYYQKGALPGLALEINQDANEGLAIRLLRSFEQAFTGRTNQRRTLLLPKGVTSK